MKKKLLALALVIVLISGTGFMIYKINSINASNQKLKTLKQQLPDFIFYSLNGASQPGKVIETGKPVCIIYFNTGCDHCHYEAELINKHITDFEKAQIIMVSPNTPKDIEAFGNLHHLNRHPQITLFWDKENKFSSWFGSSPFPSVYIYDKGHKLRKEYHGEVKIEALTKYLR